MESPQNIPCTHTVIRKINNGKCPLCARRPKNPAYPLVAVTQDFTAEELAELWNKLTAEECRRSLSRFIQEGWEVVNPGTPLFWGWHMEAVADHVQFMYEKLARAKKDPKYKIGKQNLMINIPPRSAKSMIVSVFAPAWAWTRWPELKIRCISANPKVSHRDSRYCRALIASEWYQGMFEPQWKIRPDIDAVELFSNDQGGERLSTGINAKIIGEGTDVLTIDDPHDPTEAQSETQRRAVLERYDSSIANRVNDPLRSIRIGIMQRVHEEDWAGHVLKQGGWHHLCIPMEYEPDRKYMTVLNWIDPRKELGDLMQPERFPKEWVESEKIRLGSYAYAGLMQQRPAPMEGGFFRKAWWNFFRYEGTTNNYRPAGCNDRPAILAPTNKQGEIKFDQVIVSLDCSFRESQDGSRVGCLVIGTKGANRYVIDNKTAPMDFKKTVDLVEWLFQKYKPTKFLIEGKANGDAVVSLLKNKIPNLVLVEPEGGKESRAAAMQPAVEAGNVYLLEGASWLEDFIHELSTFPNGKHDDQVDSLSQAINHLAGNAAWWDAWKMR
jgi:predicted phage terminase large subunit-like protein